MRREAVPCERVMVVVSAGQGAELRVCAERYKSKSEMQAGMYTKRFSSHPAVTGVWLCALPLTASVWHTLARSLGSE